MMGTSKPSGEDRLEVDGVSSGGCHRSEFTNDQLAGENEAVCRTVSRLEEELAQCQEKLAEVQQSEAKYQELVEESCSIVLRMDTQGNITYVNRYALSFFGYTEKELLGKNVVGTIVPFVERSGRDLVTLIRNVCEHPDQHQDNENENVQQDGTSKWIAWTNRGIRDASGQPREILCIGNDITARKKAEEALQEEQQALKQLLELQQHDLQLVAHDIHDGLAQLLSAAIIQLEIFDKLQNTEAEAATRVYQTGRDLLDRALAETRRLITDLRPPVLEESGIVDAIEQLIAVRGKNTLPQAEFVCHIHLDRLDPLLENALYRTAQEGLSNTTRHSGSKKVMITLQEDKESIALEIKDWGCGFEMSTVGADQFGLKGIRERARILGGEAFIDSIVGKGTSILVKLPMAINKTRSTVSEKSLL